MKKKFIIYVVGGVAVLIIVLGFLILTKARLPKKQIEKASQGKMRITSSAFINNGYIPKKYTCDGEDINPPLNVDEVPSNSKSLVLIVDDPDAPMGTWVHWLVFNIKSPPAGGTKEIAENSLPAGAILGKNDFGRLKYGGPCPPSGTHRYFFKIYALDTLLDLVSGAAKAEVEKAMEGHILDKGELVGLYKRG